MANNLCTTSETNASHTERFHLPFERWMPERQVLPLSYRSVAEQIENIHVKDEDVWVVTFPKSGTTWVQETIWLLLNSLDFPMALRDKIDDRSPFVEDPFVNTFETLNTLNKELFEQNMKSIENLPGRRVIKSHLCWEKLPRLLRESRAKPKIVYVARHPKDVCISYFYFTRLLGISQELSSNLEVFSDAFLEDRVLYSPYWSHVMGFWKRRKEPDILFLWYEEMKKDLTGVIKKLADFLEVPRPSEVGMENLVQHLSFDSMKNNRSVNKIDIFSLENAPENAAFMRKGIVNEWKTKMSPELSNKFDAWIKKNTDGTDFQFYH